MKFLFILFLALISSFSTCKTVRAETISVAVAASMQYAFEETKTAFEQQTGHKIQVSYSSSGKLTTQIIQGAPFDLLVSADTEFPEILQKQGFSAEPAKIYAYGTLVLWSMRKENSNFNLNQWKTLLSNPAQARPAIQKIALANPKTAPYGKAAIAVLTKTGLFEAVKEQLVYGESISQTNHYIHSGSADLGFTAKSSVMAKPMQNQGVWLEIPAELSPPIAQAAVLLKTSTSNAKALASKQFYDFLFAAAARKILLQNGYTLP